MKFEHNLQSGLLLKRYKRFLADIAINSKTFTIHCPNTGSMKGCAEPGSNIWFWDSENPKRKYRHTWELIENHLGHMIGINTNRANKLVKEAIIDGVFNNLEFDKISQEVSYGDEKSRIDLLLEKSGNKTWIEVKNVTLLDEDQPDKGIGYFPDAVTTRGSKHLRELMAQVKQGDRSVLIFCVQHTGIKTVQAAAHIDPVYASTLKQAKDAGVEIIAATTLINDQEIRITGEIPVIID